MSIESVMLSNHLIPFCPPFPLSSIFPSIRIFSNELILPIRWPNYWSFSFSLSPSSECSGLISFRMDWLDLLAVQGNLRSLLQHNSKASVLQYSAFFMAQFLQSYVTGKAISLNIQTSVSRNLFNTLLNTLFHSFFFQGARVF